MVEYSELIFYMLLLPVLLFAALPFIITAARKIIELTKRGMASITMRNEAMLAESSIQAGATWDKRKHPRLMLSGTWADISDGINSCTGVACNISKFGLGVMNLPEKFFTEAEKLSVVVNGHGNNYKMQLTPKWTSVTGSVKCIGGEIDNIPTGWTEFIQKYEPSFQA